MLNGKVDPNKNKNYKYAKNKYHKGFIIAISTLCIHKPHNS